MPKSTLKSTYAKRIRLILQAWDVKNTFIINLHYDLWHHCSLIEKYKYTFYSTSSAFIIKRFKQFLITKNMQKFLIFLIKNYQSSLSLNQSIITKFSLNLLYKNHRQLATLKSNYSTNSRGIEFFMGIAPYIAIEAIISYSCYK